MAERLGVEFQTPEGRTVTPTRPGVFQDPEQGPISERDAQELERIEAACEPQRRNWESERMRRQDSDSALPDDPMLVEQVEETPQEPTNETDEIIQSADRGRARRGPTTTGLIVDPPNPVTLPKLVTNVDMSPGAPPVATQAWLETPGPVISLPPEGEEIDLSLIHI